jgi:hypothetical protein
MKKVVVTVLLMVTLVLAYQADNTSAGDHDIIPPPHSSMAGSND